MGNTKSELCVWAVSQQMTLNYNQLKELRDVCLRESNGRSFMLSRQQLRTCLEKAAISAAPDGEIILDLFTMWDVDGTDTINMYYFLNGLCPLAVGKEETLRGFLRFVLEFNDVDNGGKIRQAVLQQVLESTFQEIMTQENHSQCSMMIGFLHLYSFAPSGMNATISLLGDTALSQKSLFQIVAGVVGSSNELFGKSSTMDGIAHTHVVRVLAFDPCVQKLVGQKHSTTDHRGGTSEGWNNESLDCEKYPGGSKRLDMSMDSVVDMDDNPVLISSSLSTDANIDLYGCGDACLPILAL